MGVDCSHLYAVLSSTLEPRAWSTCLSIIKFGEMVTGMNEMVTEMK